MKLAWATDIHLNFLDAERLARFHAQLAADGADAFVVTGDLAESDDLESHLQGLAAAVKRPLYFVLGNHDYYGGSVAAVRRRVDALCARSSDLCWLNTVDAVALTPGACLVGHDGWADGRAGDWQSSSVMLNDYRRIAELSGVGRAACLARMQALAAEGADHLRRVLPAALASHRHVVVATHVPPFAEACWHEGKMSNDEWLPHFTCVAIGDVLLEAARAHPSRTLTVLCGHTHGAGVTRPLPNLEVRTGGADYGAPALQSPFELV